MRHLVYEDNNKRCCIIAPGEEFQQTWESETHAIARLHKAAIPEVCEFYAVSEALIPKDTTFRDAWRKGTLEEPVQLDLPKCLSIHRERLKQACEDKIIQLNEELEIAIENQNLPQQVAIHRTKKILRTLHEMDLTHCKTPEDVKYSIPRELHQVWKHYSPKP